MDVRDRGHGRDDRRLRARPRDNLLRKVVLDQRVVRGREDDVLVLARTDLLLARHDVVLGELVARRTIEPRRGPAAQVQPVQRERVRLQVAHVLCLDEKGHARTATMQMVAVRLAHGPGAHDKHFHFDFTSAPARC